MTMTYLTKKDRGTKKKVSILDAHAARKIDALQVALLRISHTSVLPELYEVFGTETLLEFLDIFGGVTVEVPSREILENAIRDTFIFFQLDTCEDSEKSDVEKDLSDRYGITKLQVKHIYQDMQEFMN